LQDYISDLITKQIDSGTMPVLVNTTSIVVFFCFTNSGFVVKYGYKGMITTSTDIECRRDHYQTYNNLIEKGV